MIIQFLKKFGQALLIVALLVFCFMSVRSCKNNADRATIATHKADSSYLVAKYYRDKSGNLVAQVKTHELTVKNLKEFAAELGFDRHKLKEQVGSLSNLVAYWQAKAGTSDTAVVTLHDTVFIDSKTGQQIFAKKFDWNNKYMFLNGLVTDKEIRIGYNYDVKFSLTAYHQPQRGFWKPPGQLVADIRFDDPNMKVTEFKGFVVKEGRKRWYQTNGFKYGSGFLLGGYAAWRMTR